MKTISQLGDSMSITRVRFIQTLLLVSCLMTFRPVSAGSVGTIIFKTGDVSVTRADNTVLHAEKDLSLVSGDTIETRDGRVQFSLMDGGKISLQPNSVFKISKYAFSGKEDGSEFAITELIKGGLRTITGLIGHKNPERYQLKTSVATIGIRGTEFTVNFINNQFLMTANHGSVDVCGLGGNCLNAVTGQSIAVNGVGGAPKFSSKKAVASASAPATTSKAEFTAADATSNIAASPNGATGSTNGLPAVVASSVPAAVAGALPTNSTTLSLVDDFAGGIVFNTHEGETKYNDNTSLEEFKYNPNGTDKFEVKPVSFNSYNTDGVIAWGQASAGKYTLHAGGVPLDNNEDFVRYDYISGATPNPGVLTNMTGTYTIFASTAPFLVSGGTTSTVGSANSLNGGTFNFNFTNQTFGYNFQVSAAGNDFMLSKSGASLNGINPNFAADGTVTSLTNSNLICQTGCTGALGGNLVQGSFLGPNGERVGLQYGFNVPGLAGSIYGSAVLK